MNTAPLHEMIESLDVPESAYEKAKKRYEDIGQWLEGDEAQSCQYSPHVFPQGSFRLGTAIRPLSGDEDYDLDLACKLREGVTKNTCSQKKLKELLGGDIEAYRKSRGIVAPVRPKHRCWRLEYQDELSFHLDIVPCIPEEEFTRTLLKEAMARSGEDDGLAKQVAALAVSITDDRRTDYARISRDWLVSNPEGYALWFESRMRLADDFLLERAQFEKVASIDKLPYHQWKTPLQRCIQLLKRHRDQMFKNNRDAKPISVIITTLASRAYQGESDVGSALEGILERMGDLVGDETPRVPNPVNPEEDFADRWSMPEYEHLQLEGNFNVWLEAAKACFATVGNSGDVPFIVKQAASKLGLALNESRLREAMGSVSPNIHVPKDVAIADSSKPWSE